MPKNPWVQSPRVTPEEMRKAMEEFKNKGGEVISLPEGFKEDNRAHSSTAVKIGSLALKLRALKKN